MNDGFCCVRFVFLALLARRLAGKNVSKMTHLESNGTLNLNHSTRCSVISEIATQRGGQEFPGLVGNPCDMSWLCDR